MLRRSSATVGFSMRISPVRHNRSKSAVNSTRWALRFPDGPALWRNCMSMRCCSSTEARLASVGCAVKTGSTSTLRKASRMDSAVPPARTSSTNWSAQSPRSASGDPDSSRRSRKVSETRSSTVLRSWKAMASARPNRAGGSPTAARTGSAWDAHGIQRASSSSPKPESTSASESANHRMS